MSDRPFATTPGIAALLPQVPSNATLTGPFGATPKGPAANGNWSVEVASYGIEWSGAQYDVFEPLYATFADCVAATIAKGHPVDAAVAKAEPYNAGWIAGNGVVMPVTEDAPVFP